jgi:hypothetical protein
MLEIAALAGMVVSKFLIPLLTKGKDNLAEELASTGAKGAAGALASTAESLWDRIKARFVDDDEKNVVALFEKNPNGMEQMLSSTLEQRLVHDDKLRKELSDIVESSVAGTGKTAWQLMGDYVGAVDARHATISGGTVAGMIVNSPTRPQPQRPPPGRDDEP